MRTTLVILATILLLQTKSAAQDQPAGHFPFLTVDARKKEIKVDCEAIDCRNPLEFFLCSTGTNEHESVLRSKVRPSHLHAALLMIGLQPGEPVHFDEQTKKWIPPHGPPLDLVVRFERDKRTIELPAYRLMRDIKSKKEMPPLTWIFTGSRVMENGVYAADQTGYLVSVVNFDLTVIDIPKLASSANETLEWEINKDLAPPGGTPVTLIITPAAQVNAPATRASAISPAPAKINNPLVTIDSSGNIKLDDAPVENPRSLVEQIKARKLPDRTVRIAMANAIEDNPTAREVINALSRADIAFLTIPQAQAVATTTHPIQPAADDDLVQRLTDEWNQKVAPKDATLRDAAKSHAEIIAQLRAEQQRLIDAADRIQRLIDQLDKRYQEMTQPPQQ